MSRSNTVRPATRLRVHSVVKATIAADADTVRKVNVYNADEKRHWPPSGGASLCAWNAQRLADLVLKYSISAPLAERLTVLAAYRTVLVLDDSESMRATLAYSPLNVGVRDERATRWHELAHFARIALELANVFNATHCTDVHFLNRPSARRVRSADALAAYLLHAPVGCTPLTRVLATVLGENEAAAGGSPDWRPLLCVVLTDGEPTDEQGRADVAGLRCLLQRQHRVDSSSVDSSSIGSSNNKSSSVGASGGLAHTVIVSCTDELSAMAYLDKWDAVIPGLTVVDDYQSERARALRAFDAGAGDARCGRFSYGDYVAKALVAGVVAAPRELAQIYGVRQAETDACITCSIL